MKADIDQVAGIGSAGLEGIRLAGEDNHLVAGIQADHLVVEGSRLVARGTQIGPEEGSRLVAGGTQVGPEEGSRLAVAGSRADHLAAEDIQVDHLVAEGSRLVEEDTVVEDSRAGLEESAWCIEVVVADEFDSWVVVAGTVEAGIGPAVLAVDPGSSTVDCLKGIAEAGIGPIEEDIDLAVGHQVVGAGTVEVGIAQADRGS